MIRRCILSDKEKWCELNLEFMAYEYEEENVWENPLKKGDPGDIFEEIIRDDKSPNILLKREEMLSVLLTQHILQVSGHTVRYCL